MSDITLCPQKLYRAVKYIRLSDADNKRDKNGNHIEKIESDSISNQRKFIDNWLEIEVVGEKIDDGYTGKDFERPAFKEMMEDIESGKINCVITRDLSRFGREYI
ncbi:hypothetical protein FACS189499_06210 [Clostridia bacterium]|nr:hypothetical protein FACS189499_06210 [Clostridia bacterium]